METKITAREWISGDHFEKRDYDVKRYAIVGTWIFGTPLCAICRKDIKDDEMVATEAENGRVFQVHQVCFSKGH